MSTLNRRPVTHAVRATFSCTDRPGPRRRAEGGFGLDEAPTASVISLWKRRPEIERRRPMFRKPRFDPAHATVIATQADLLAMRPGIARPLSARFDAPELADRICPVLLSDDTVAILATPDDVGGDHAGELAWRIALSGGRDPSQIVRYVLSASLLLEVTRGGLSARISFAADSARAALSPSLKHTL
ncbi:MAG: hypothetical protein WC284_09105 [Candidimonas sp.]